MCAKRKKHWRSMERKNIEMEHIKKGQIVMRVEHNKYAWSDEKKKICTELRKHALTGMRSPRKHMRSIEKKKTHVECIKHWLTMMHPKHRKKCVECRKEENTRGA